MSKATTLLGQLLKAQAEFPEIPKDRENTYFKSRYSTLDAIISNTRPPLNKHGIIADHYAERIEGRWHMVARLTLAASGETRINPFPMSPEFDTLPPQARGSEITYGRRYSLAPLLGITSDEDDDGNAARPDASTTRAANTKSEPPPKLKKSIEDIFREQQTAAAFATLLQGWVGKRPVAKNAEHWSDVVKKAGLHLAAQSWPDEQKAIVNAVLTGIRNEIASDKAPPATASTAQPATPAGPPPSQESIAGWMENQETPDDLQKVLATLLQGWVGKRPVAKNAEHWSDVVKKAGLHLAAQSWPDEQKAIVNAVLTGIRNEIASDKAPPATASTAQPATPAGPPPSQESIAGWMENQETPDDLQKVLATLETSGKFTDLRAHADQMLIAIAHADKVLDGKQNSGEWKPEATAALTATIVAMNTKYDLSQQATETFGSEDETKASAD